MAKNIPAVPNPGDVATVANWAQKVVDSLTAALYSGDVTTSVIKTGTDNGQVTLNSGEHAGLTMQDFTFFPNFYGNYQMKIGNIRTDVGGGTQIARVEIYSETGSSGETSAYFGYNYRYITASGPPEIWIGIDVNDFIVAAVIGDDPQKGRPPINHPRIVKWFILKPSKEELDALRTENADVPQALASEARIKKGKLIFRNREWEISPFQYNR